MGLALALLVLLVMICGPGSCGTADVALAYRCPSVCSSGRRARAALYVQRLHILIS